MKTVSRIISSASIALALTLLLAFAKSSAFVFIPLWQPFSAQLLETIGSVTGSVAFPVWEVIAALLLVWFVATFIHALRHLKLLRWLSGVLFGVSVGALLFAFVWGAGLFLPGKTEGIVSVREYTLPELREASMHYGKEAGALASLAPRDTDGTLKLPSWDELSDEANASFERLSALHPEFITTPTPVKPLTPGPLFRHLGTQSVFIPFTAEPSVNPDAYPAELPTQFCRALAHRFGAYAVSDAEFCAYLACRQSSDPAFRYSGSFAALKSCYHALRAEDEALAAELWNTLPPLLQADLLAADAHEEPYRGAVQDAAQKVSDAYLAALEEQGARSYGRFSDALIALYRSENQKTAN